MTYAYQSVADTHLPTHVPREPIKIIGGSGPDPLAREVGAAKVKDMQRDAVRRTLVPPEKELLVERERERDTPQQKSGTGLRSMLHKTGPSLQALKSRVDVDGGVGGDADDGRQPLVVLVPEDELFTVEAKREELKKSRFNRVEACCKVRKLWTRAVRGSS